VVSQKLTLRQGVIMPETNQNLLPFQVQNVKTANVIVTKIFQNNILQFLQNNNMNENYDLNPVGKVIAEKKINFEEIGSSPKSDEWTKYTLDLSKIISLEKGAIYNIKIQFTKEDVLQLNCQSYDDNEDQDDYSYSDPCSNGYYYEYQNNFINMNVFSSDIGIIGKSQKDNKAFAILTDIYTGEPINGAEVTFYSFQKQILSTSKSNELGIAISNKNEEKSSFIIAQNKGVYGYLNLEESYVKSMTEFDIEGKALESGLDAFIYGERGVYRPGDSMHISVMVFDHSNYPSNQLSKDFPIRLKAYDSRSKLQYDKIVKSQNNNIYFANIPIAENGSTGNWKLVAELGNENFVKYIKVEAIKPNRLKINYNNLSKNINLYENPVLNLSAIWLHGALADGLSANVTVNYEPYEIKFKSYSKYNFKDPAREFLGTNSEVYNGNLDGNGMANFGITKEASLLPPSAIKATLKTKVFEKSGNFSEDFGNYIAHPYKNYVGIRLPENKWGGAYYESDKDINFSAVLVNENGKPIANKKLDVGFYEAKWDWWYNESNFDILKYNTASHIGALKTMTVTTNSKGEANIKDKFLDGMNYLIRVCDPESGHCTGDYFYTSRWGTPPSDNNGAQIIKLSSDKEEYNIGDNAIINVPSYEGSSLVISVEKGNEVKEIKRMKCIGSNTSVSIPITEDLFPNSYVYFSLLQPYSNDKSNLPTRMYGVVNINVIDKNKTLTPIIQAPKSGEPNKSFNIQVSESNGQAMSYTLAVVDEGLLSLTRYKTPNPGEYFYARQSLGVSTWDMYDLIMSKYGDEYENIFSIGGDGEIVNIASPKKADRFVPISKHLGIFTLEKGSKNTHNITIPNYIGEVRVMVIAKSDKKFGQAEQAIQIKQELMVQNTLPRVLSPGDEVIFGTNVFTMNDKIKNVALSIKGNNMFNIPSATSNLSFEKQGDKLQTFPINVTENEGIGTLRSEVQSGNYKSYEENKILIRNPNEIRYETKDVVLSPGKKMDIAVNLFGIPGSNKASIELSNSPNINLAKRLGYLLNYPYGCAEQITSGAYAQLYLNDFVNLSPLRTQQRTNNITSTIQRLSHYQLSSGAFSYWPGNTDYNEWITNYVGHFLLSAKSKGFFVNEDMLKKWAAFQKNKATTYNETFENLNQIQAYRLYTLALYGKPEIAAMNKLKSSKSLNQTTSYQLAASYANIGKSNIASEIIKLAAKQNTKEIFDYYTYGSNIRNRSILAEALLASGKESEAIAIIKGIEKDLNTNSYYDTHGLAYALVVIQKFYGAGTKSDINVAYEWNGTKETMSSSKSVSLSDLIIKNKATKNLLMTNNGKSNIYLRLITSGKDPVNQNLPSKSNHVALNVKYTTIDGQTVDIMNLNQGTNFFVHIDVVNNGTFKGTLNNMALSFTAPAGWEINNDRLANIDNSNIGVDYQQITDDKVNSFFTLNKKMSVKIPITATYAGSYYYPAITCESMYLKEVYANTNSSRVTVNAKMNAN
jgi:alpha-2-macroglobulin